LAASAVLQQPSRWLLLRRHMSVRPCVPQSLIHVEYMGGTHQPAQKSLPEVNK
jgi:hypothetical protein